MKATLRRVQVVAVIEQVTTADCVDQAALEEIELSMQTEAVKGGKSSKSSILAKSFKEGSGINGVKVLIRSFDGTRLGI